VKIYLDRDISQLITLRDKVKFKNLLRVLTSLTGQEFIPDNIAKTIGVNKNTVKAWTDIAVAGDILTLLSPYYENSINKRIVKRHKLYHGESMNYVHKSNSEVRIDLARAEKSLFLWFPLPFNDDFWYNCYVHDMYRKNAIGNYTVPPEILALKPKGTIVKKIKSKK